MTSVRLAEFPRDRTAVARLLSAYLRATEAEKAQHGLVAADAPLPDRYAREIANPEEALAGRCVLIATRDGADCGVVVVSKASEAAEISRFWTTPTVRGRGVGAALLRAAVNHAGRPVRLSVWSWRDPAIRLYRRHGFEVVPPWDDRPDLVCLERPE
jgi:GNAT superfamily N-acetyltransferase